MVVRAGGWARQTSCGRWSLCVGEKLEQVPGIVRPAEVGGVSVWVLPFYVWELQLSQLALGWVTLLLGKPMLFMPRLSHFFDISYVIKQLGIP